MSNKPHVYLRVQLGHYPSDADFSFVMPISELARAEIAPIDEPGPIESSADFMAAIIFCTPADVIRDVKRNRKQLAERIADEILNQISKHDTTNGYPRELQA